MDCWVISMTSGWCSQRTLPRRGRLRNSAECFSACSTPTTRNCVTIPTVTICLCPHLMRSCQPPSSQRATTPTSTPPSTTRPMSARCSDPTTRSSPTTSTSPSATTGGHPPSSPRAPASSDPSDSKHPTRGPARPTSGRASCWITRWRWASSSGVATNWALGSRSRRPRTTSWACASSTTGRRGTCRSGNTSRWARSWPRTSPRRFRRTS